MFYVNVGHLRKHAYDNIFKVILVDETILPIIGARIHCFSRTETNAVNLNFHIDHCQNSILYTQEMACDLLD